MKEYGVKQGLEENYIFEGDTFFECFAFILKEIGDNLIETGFNSNGDYSIWYIPGAYEFYRVKTEITGLVPFRGG